MKNFGYVIASKRLVDNKKKVRFMYREEPDNRMDSGWRFFCGDEDEAFCKNPDNFAMYDINTILSIDPSIQEYLDSDTDVAFERKNENDAFQVCELKKQL